MKPHLKNSKLLGFAVAAAILSATPLTAFAAPPQDAAAGQPAAPTAADNLVTAVEEAPTTFFLDEMVITATRVPVDAFHANANINVVTAEQIENRHYSSLSDALRAVPGVDIRTHGTPGSGYDSSDSLKINGANAAVLVDGVKVTSANNNFAASALRNLDNIERIEVLKGAASTLYGADAKGGVINIITKKPEGVKTTLKAEGGSYDTSRFSLNHEGREKDWYWNIYYDNYRTKDFKDAHHQKLPAYTLADSTSIKIGKKFGEKHDLSFSYDAYDADTRYAALSEITNGPGVQCGNTNDEKYRLNLESKFDENTSNSLNYLHGFNRYITDRDNVTYKIEPWGPSGGIGKYQVEADRISDQFTKHFGDKNTLIIGAEYAHEKIREFYYSKGSIKTNYNTSAVYLQDQHNITDALKLTAGIRYDHHSQYGNNTSPSVNLGYEFSDNTNMYVSYNKYFLAPTTVQLYYPGYGNPNLKAEKGHNKEIGFNHRFSDKFAISTHYFWRKSSNKIGNVYDAMGSHLENIDTEKSHGWDIQAKQRFGKYYTASVGYTHLNVGRNNDNGYQPTGAWNIGLDYSHDRLDANLTARGIINRPGPVAGFSMPTDTYWVFDMAANYKVKDNVKVYAKFNNIFNQYYAEQTLSTYSGANPNDWWTAPGRNFMVGVEVSF